MAKLPEPSGLARALPSALAQAGGAATISGIERNLHAGNSSGEANDQQWAYLREAFAQAIEMLVRSEVIHRDGDSITLTDKGWAQSRALDAADGGGESARPASSAPEPGAMIDLSDAKPYVSHQLRDGTKVMGYLRDDAQKYHGRPYVPPASDLLDALYRAEIDGVRVSEGLFSALREVGVTQGATDVLTGKCGVRIPGLGRAEPSRHPVGKPGRKPGLSWPRLVCEVLGELGDHADWPTIAESVGHQPLAEEHRSWREEVRQALRNNTVPKGHQYFDIAELGGTAIYTLTEQGKRLAAKRSEDDRAPTLSKLFAKAIALDDDSLTDYELYALLHLAAELGKPNVVQAIYQRLPEAFPDEDRYYMAGHLLDRAEEVRKATG